MKICVAEDDLVYRHVLDSFLSDWGFEVVAADDGKTAWETLNDPAGPRMAILNWLMPGLDGWQLCQQIRQLPEDRYIYVILLTARHAKEHVLQGLQGGADDYLVKPFDPPELLARLNVGRRLITVQQELIATREAMRLQATRDSLTGLWNRRSILEILERELSKAARDHQFLGVALADLDHFKQINDGFGHLAGDEVLKEAARRAEGVLRMYDSVGRYGGEEFLLVFPGCDPDEAHQCAERVRQNIGTAPVFHEGRPIPVTASIGVAAYDATSLPTMSTILQMADCGLYQAKSGGRNCVSFDRK